MLSDQEEGRDNMESKQRKVIRHPFGDRYTIPAFIVFVAFAFGISELLIGGIIGGVIGAAISGGDTTSTAMTVSTEIGTMIGGFMVLAIFWRWFYPEYEGGLRGGNRIWFWTGIGLLITVACSAPMLFELDRLGVPPVVSFVGAFMAGLTEEAIFRGIGASYLMRQWRDEKKILPVLFLTSVVFAIAHMSNVFSGAPLSSSIIQTVHSFAIGCVFCALFIRSGNLIPGIIMHTANDIIAFTDVSAMGENGITYTGSMTISVFDIVSTLALDAVLVAIALYLTRPSVRAQILEVWDRKWNRAQ